MFQKNIRSLVLALRQMAGTPLSTLATVLLLSLSFSFLVTLYSVSKNLQELSGGHFKPVPELVVFLKNSADEKSATDVYEAVKSVSGVKHATMLSAMDAQSEFQSVTGVALSFDSFQNTGFSWTILVEPHDSVKSKEAFRLLATELRNLPSVKAVEYDSNWASVLLAVDNLSKITFWSVASLAIILCVLLVFHSCRSIVFNQLEDIKVYNQLGASLTFIRKPLIYTSILQILVGTAISVAIVASILELLKTNITQLTLHYQLSIELNKHTWMAWLVIFIIAFLLSVVIVRVMVYQYLKLNKS